MRLVPGTSTAALLNASLLFGPLAYLFLDSTYAVRGWWEAPTGALHLVAASAWGLTALRLAFLGHGRLQALMVVVAILGTVGNYGVGQNTIAVGDGGLDLFSAAGPAAGVFKAMGFFFPLTFALAAIAVLGRVPAWIPVSLGTCAVLFPVAHVGNVAWLAIAVAVLMVLTLGALYAGRDDYLTSERSRRHMPRQNGSTSHSRPDVAS